MWTHPPGKSGMIRTTTFGFVPFTGMQFDLHSSQGVVQALQAIRNSSLSADDKNELRDLVFLYTNGGGDQGIKAQLEEKLQTLGSTQNAPQGETTAPAPQPAPTPAPAPIATLQQTQPEAPSTTGAVSTASFASPRPAPTFSVPTPIVSPTPAPQPSATATTPAPAPTHIPVPSAAAPQPVPVPSPAPAAPTPQPVVSPTPATPTPQPAPQAVPQPVSPTPTAPTAPQAVPVAAQPPTPTPATPAQPTPVMPPTPAVPVVPVASQVPPQPVVPPTPAAQPVIPQTAPVPPAPPISAPAQPAPATPGVDLNAVESNALNRIRQIKAEVNAAVGNPVNLVDINNEVGREYMNALLGAMKKLNMGAPGELQVAMERLEKAFVSVKDTIANQGSNPPQTPAPDKQPSSPPPQAAPAAPVPAAVPDSKPTAPATTEGGAKRDTQTLVDSLTANLKADRKENPVYEAPPTDESVVATAPPPSQPAPTADTPPVEPVPPPVASTTPPTTVASGKQIGYGGAAPSPIKSVAQSAHAFNPLTPNVEKTESVDTDPNGAEVTAGLQQLLSEWSLFKSSGLFGTGPNGSEHPLYKKLRELPIAHILAGRYEGAKPDIKQSITDYMNGWRYEQGIVYQPGETFEVYLRRVIKQIIDSQKKQSQA